MTTVKWPNLVDTSQPSYQQGKGVRFSRLDPEKGINEHDMKENSSPTPLTVVLPPNGTSNADDTGDEAENDIETVLFCHRSFEMTIAVGETFDEMASPEDPPLSICQNLKGEIIITTRRVLFAVQEYPQQEKFDLFINSNLIGLFALSNNSPDDDVFENSNEDEDENDDEAGGGLVDHCIYVQFNIPNEGGNTQPIEMYLSLSSSPFNVEDRSKEETAQTTNENKLLQELFDALSQTAELNPPYDDDDDDENENYMGGQGQYGYDDSYFGLDTGEGFCMRMDDEDEEKRREEVLNKLDSMLIVPPELDKDQTNEGQFDDAEEDDDDLL